MCKLHNSKALGSVPSTSSPPTYWPCWWSNRASLWVYHKVLCSVMMKCLLSLTWLCWFFQALGFLCNLFLALDCPQLSRLGSGRGLSEFGGPFSSFPSWAALSQCRHSPALGSHGRSIFGQWRLLLLLLSSGVVSIYWSPSELASAYLHPGLWPWPCTWLLFLLGCVGEHHAVWPYTGKILYLHGNNSL